MCCRFQTFFGISLVKVAAFVAYYSVFLTIAAYIISGYYLFQRLAYGDLGEYEGWDDTYAYAVYGSVYLAMAALWTAVTTALFFGISSSNHCLIVPWLSLQMISILMACCNIIERLVVACDVMGFVALPFIFIGVVHFMCVYAYFMELMDAKVSERFSNTPGPYY